MIQHACNVAWAGWNKPIKCLNAKFGIEAHQLGDQVIKQTIKSFSWFIQKKKKALVVLKTSSLIQTSCECTSLQKHTQDAISIIIL